MACRAPTLLREEVADQLPFLFVLDAREQFRVQGLDRLGAIEGHLGVNLTAAEVTGLAPRFEDGLDLRGEVYFCLFRCAARISGGR